MHKFLLIVIFLLIEVTEVRAQTISISNIDTTINIDTIVHPGNFKQVIITLPYISRPETQHYLQISVTKQIFPAGGFVDVNMLFPSPAHWQIGSKAIIEYEDSSKPDTLYHFVLMFPTVDLWFPFDLKGGMSSIDFMNFPDIPSTPFSNLVKNWKKIHLIEGTGVYDKTIDFALTKEESALIKRAMEIAMTFFQKAG
jgi:hypothetical protein